MERDILFSVVMPVYGVEKHLKQAVESVLAQTYKNFEIILVDDASPDECPLICEEYAKKYGNIKCVHHEQNKGLSAARNTGLSYVSGEYVTFMDSDDYINSDLLERVKVSLDKNFADCVVFLSGDGITVAVPAPAEGLSDAAVARISDTVVAETGCDLTKLKIIEVKDVE